MKNFNIHETTAIKFYWHSYLERATDRALLFIRENKVVVKDVIKVKVTNENKSYSRRFIFRVDNAIIGDGYSIRYIHP